uniref:Uncharacterized protein n=1 Tax=Romanomermis culicivorax TaxID=13658 RepID=A0A915JFK9_ROMCU
MNDAIVLNSFNKYLISSKKRKSIDLLLLKIDQKIWNDSQIWYALLVCEKNDVTKKQSPFKEIREELSIQGIDFMVHTWKELLAEQKYEPELTRLHNNIFIFGSAEAFRGKRALDDSV